MSPDNIYKAFASASESPTPANIPSSFPDSADIETSSDDYANRFSGKIGAYFLYVQEKITLEFLKPWPKALVLDVGGGHAQIAAPLVRHGYEVTVTGSSDVCRKRLDMLLDRNSFKFRKCNLLSLPFEDKSFDVVLAFRLLPHVKQWKTLVAELGRVSRGDIIVDYPDLISFNFLSRQFFRAKRAIEGNTRPYRCFLRSELLEEFANHGFAQSNIRPEFFIPMVIHRAIGLVTISKTMEFLSRLLGMTRIFGSPVILCLSRIDENLLK